MPITINPQNPAGLVGPGLSLRLQTDFIGPLPSTNLWTVTFTRPSDEVRAFEGIWRTNSNPVIVTPYISDTRLTSSSAADSVFAEGSSSTVNVVIQPSGGGPAEDSGTAVAPWSNVAGLTNVIIKEQGTGAGLTPEEATQLEQTHAQTFLSQTLDAVTLTPLTTGPSGGTISSFLPTPTFGVIVRIASVPPDLAPNTPDGDYWFPSLAVVRVFRGSDLWLRVPIHTSSKLVPFGDENLVVGVSALTLTQWILQLSIQVSFRDGVTGEVFLMHFP